MPVWLQILDGLFWLFVLGGLLWLAWQHRGEFNLEQAHEPADPRFYVGPFYNNPEDPRLLVPKPFGLIWLGVTVNLAHPHARTALIAIFLVVLASVTLGVLVRP